MGFFLAFKNLFRNRQAALRSRSSPRARFLAFHSSRTRKKPVMFASISRASSSVGGRALRRLQSSSVRALRSSAGLSPPPNGLSERDSSTGFLEGRIGYTEPRDAMREARRI